MGIPIWNKNYKQLPTVSICLFSTTLQNQRQPSRADISYFFKVMLLSLWRTTCTSKIEVGILRLKYFKICYSAPLKMRPYSVTSSLKKTAVNKGRK